MIDAVADETPRDPRLVRLASAIASGESPGAAAEPLQPVPPRGPATSPKMASSNVDPSPQVPTNESIETRAKRTYRWVLSNIEAGRETDGRRAVMGRSGNRSEAFVYLCRLNGIQADFGLVRDRLAPPAAGPMTEAESFSAPAVRLLTEHGPRWMLVHDRFAPFGYLPSSLRGQAAIVLRAGVPRELTTSAGIPDGVTHEGTAELAADGGARLEIEQRYEGKLAILLRTAFGQLPEARFKEAIESRLVPQLLPGARVLSADVHNLDALDEPLILRLKLEMASFARLHGRNLQIPLFFPLRLGTLATLPSRETPLYLSEALAGCVTLRLRVKLPTGAHVATTFETLTADNDGRSLRIDDRVEGSMLVLDRFVNIPAGRVSPAGYQSFQAFARRVDAALRQDVVVTLDGAK
jgi:hypothetical protein